jgi:hypothetical protein
MIQNIHPRSASRIRIPDPDVKKASDPGSPNTAGKNETHLWCLALVQQRFISRHNDAIHALVELAHRVTSEEKMAMLTLIIMAKKMTLFCLKAR